MTALRALLEHVIDYAGLYPPAELPLPEVLANYERYLQSPEAWMLSRLVLPLDTLNKVTLGADWRLTVLADKEPGTLPAQVETLETKSANRLSLPTYCEVPLDQVHGAWAKIRTAGITTEALADFICAGASKRLPFKATAGLHHPIRSREMHGFLNVFVAAVFARVGMTQETLMRLLDDTDPQSFKFTDTELRWRDWFASIEQVREARRDFAHSFGSCSFEEPVSDLRALGFLQ